MVAIATMLVLQLRSIGEDHVNNFSCHIIIVINLIKVKIQIPSNQTKGTIKTQNPNDKTIT